MKESIFVSACLLGENCKYNGKNNLSEKVVKLKDKYNLIEICPEVMAGLGIPRETCEIRGSKVVTVNGKDITSLFLKVNETLCSLIKEHNVRLAVLKEGSPSCGVNRIKDGTFTSTDIEGCGITTKYLIANGINIQSDEEL